MEARKGQINKTGIVMKRLGVNDAAIDFIHSFYVDPDMTKNMSDYQLQFRHIINIIDQFRMGSVMIYVPMIDDLPAGMGSFTFINITIIQGHQGIFREYRRHAFDIMKAGLDQVFEDHPQIKAIMGFTPTFNKPATRLALKCGFTTQGKTEKTYLHNGNLHDCHIMVCQRGKQ